MNMSVINLDKIEYVTLYTGNNGAKFCTCKCPCCSQKGRERHYQGTMSQINVLLNKIPNIKQLYLFGNPDVSVDADFCHAVINEAVKRNIHICFSTSGVGGKEILTKLLNGISTKMVDYISFSFDGITQEEMSFSKGISYPMEKSLQGLEWAIDNGYITKIQPTLWSYNYKNVEKIICFFRNKGVKWFTFHIGSLEAGIYLPSHQHLTPNQIKCVHNQICKAVQKYNDIKVRCPIIYPECGENDKQKWYCMHPQRAKELLIILTENGIEATHAPIASLIWEDLIFRLDVEQIKDVPAIPENDFCPFSKKLSGRDDTYCRYISKYWNY